MSYRYTQMYPTIKHNQKIFESLLTEIKRTENIPERLEKAQQALNFAVNNSTGYFSSHFLEDFYTDYAQTLANNFPLATARKNSFLHVLTTGYKTGGHTRVVERWIKNAPDDQIHSVILLSQTSEIGSVLQKNVQEKNGEYIIFPLGLSLAERALRLREIAYKYQYIILHTHMDDPTAVVAFGDKNFPRPVLLYNHASHRFWIGKSIADKTLDIIENDQTTIYKRQIPNAFFLGIPHEQYQFKTPDKEALRKKLNIPLDKKIIVSSGNTVKYTPIGNDNLYDLLSQIIEPDTICYIIGISPKDKVWQQLCKKNKHNNIVPLGYIDFDNGYTDYLTAADLYVDSYPLGGGTAVIDAVSSGTPVLSLKSPDTQVDFLTSTNAYCQTKKEFISKSKKILNDNQFSYQIMQELQASLKHYCSAEIWNQNIEKLLSETPLKHQIVRYGNMPDYKKIDDLSVLNNIVYNKYASSHKPKLFFKLAYLIKIYIYKHLLKNHNKAIKYTNLYNFIR